MIKAYRTELITTTEYESRCGEIYARRESAVECLKAIITEIFRTYEDVKTVKDFDGTSVELSVDNGRKRLYVHIEEVEIRLAFTDFGFYV